MGQLRVQLRLLNEDGLHPRELEHYLIPNVQVVIQIVKGKDDGSVICRAEDGENKRAQDVVARFHCTNLSIALEPFVNATVDTLVTGLPPEAGDAPRVVIPTSVHYARNFIYLRAQDTISFLDRGLKVEVAVVEDESVATTPASPLSASTAIDNDDGTTVQVKSSNTEPDIDAVDAKSEFDHRSIHEDDMSPVARVSNGAISSAIHTTPLKSRSTDITVKETPKHEDSTADDEDTFQYSTAPNKLLDDVQSDVQGTESSRLIPAAESSLAKEQTALSRRFDDEEASRPQTPSTVTDGAPTPLAGTPASSSANDYEFSPRKKVVITYGKRRSRHATTPKAVEDNKTVDVEGQPRETVSRPSSDTTAVETTRENLDTDEANVLTSEIDSAHSLAQEAAIRTMSNASGKRKLSEQIDLVREESTSQKKKQRTQEPTSSHSFMGSDDEDKQMHGFNASESNREREESTDSSSSADNSRPNGRSTQESEEIAVASRKASLPRIPKPRQASPSVVIDNARETKTLPSSATSFNLTGKMPKILLSNETATRNSPTVKKWLKKIRATVIDTVPARGSDFVCVVPKDHSLKSAKVLHTLVMNKPVVTDNWLDDSQSVNELQSAENYVHKTIKKNGEHDRSRIFLDMHLFFTETVITNYKHGWEDIQEVAKAAGAVEVDRVRFNRASFLRDRDDVIFFGSDKGDSQTSRLIQDHGRTVYSKQFFTDTIISGKLDRDSDDHKLIIKSSGKRRGLS